MRSERNERRTAAVVLAAGQGKRMESPIQKQFMLLGGRPMVYYSLKAFEDSEVDDVILVTGKDDVDYCAENIVRQFSLSKVRAVVPGGKERYHSVYEGLKAIERLYRNEMIPDTGLSVLIHDGARPFLNQRIINASVAGAQKYRACVVGMPVKDTIKLTDENGFCKETPDRRNLWMIQTPQAFEYKLVREAYDRPVDSSLVGETKTDDAMVVEKMTDTKVRIIQGDYRNIKLTTPEDMILARAFFQEEQSRLGRE